MLNSLNYLPTMETLAVFGLTACGIRKMLTGALRKPILSFTNFNRPHWLEAITIAHRMKGKTSRCLKKICPATTLPVLHLNKKLVISQKKYVKPLITAGALTCKTI